MNKVLLFFTGSYPYGNGETFIENEIEFLSKAFDKVIIISNDTLNDQTRRIPDNIKLYRLPYELSNIEKIISYKSIFYSIFWKELRIIKSIYKKNISKSIINTMCQTLYKSKIWEKYINNIIDCECNINNQIYLYSYWNNDIAFAIANYKRKNIKVNAFSRMHGWDTYFEVNIIDYLPFRNEIFNNLNKVFAISEKGKEYYNNWFPHLHSKINVSYLGTNYKGQNPANSSDVFQILTISNTIAVKNIQMLVDALSRLKIPFHWTHFGDGNLQEEIRTQANNIIPGKFSLKGRLSNNEILNYLETNPFDLFINVSLSEGIPVSIMETMSFGIPCIATAVGGTPEIVNSDNGILISSRTTPEEIALAINNFYHNSMETKQKMRENAFKTWEGKFNATKNYTKFVDNILRNNYNVGK